jgi:hypothetical protein
MSETRFPLTRSEVMALREREGFVTPIEPVEPGSIWCIWDSRGTYEFLVHPDDAARYLEHGISINGQRLDVTKIGEWPMIGAWHIHCVDAEANREFTPDVRQQPFQAPV